MAASIEIIEAEALRLSAPERARLIERLIASLDVDPGIEEAWASEVERRNRELESGKVASLSGPEALEKLKAVFKSCIACIPKRQWTFGMQQNSIVSAPETNSRSRFSRNLNMPLVFYLTTRR